MRISDQKLKRIQFFASFGMSMAVVHTGFWCLATLVALFARPEGEELSTVLNVITSSLVCVGLGVLWFRNSRRKYHFRKTCVKYAEVLTLHPRITIADLASHLDEDEKAVRKNVTYIIRKRCIEGIRYTFQGDFVTVDSLVQNEPQPQPQLRTEAPKPEIKQTMVAVSCESCCGITMLPMNSEGLCDYCGSKIKS